MASSRRVNNLVRAKLRRLRKHKGLGLGELASVAGMPLSSYACLEAGHYKISLENLFRILKALQADIGEVWPAESEGVGAESGRGHSLQIQKLRLDEVLSLSGGEAIAVLEMVAGRCRVLLQKNFSEQERQILVQSQEQGRVQPDGLWFSQEDGDRRVLVFLRAQNCPLFVKQLISHYLVIWKKVI